VHSTTAKYLEKLTVAFYETENFITLGQLNAINALKT
jgi:hypothetical protein